MKANRRYRGGLGIACGIGLLCSLSQSVLVYGQLPPPITVSDDCLPPQNSDYLGVFHARYNVPGLGIVLLSNPLHCIFTRCDRPPTHGKTTTHTFESQVQGTVTFPGPTSSSFEAPAIVTVKVTFADKDLKTRFFDTEMLQLDISGGNFPPTVKIRESPTLSSLGQTVITRIPRGDFQISSFFDIYTELSIDSGRTWTPSTDSLGNPFAGRMMLGQGGCGLNRAENSRMERETGVIPSDFALGQNYPNPFNPETNISYSLPEALHARLVIYDVLGREVKVLVDQVQPAGHYVALWDGTNKNGSPVTSGVYFYRMTAGSFRSMQRMLLLK